MRGRRRGAYRLEDYPAIPRLHADSGYTVLANDDDLDLGRDFGERYFDGQLDDVQLYDRVLPEADIAQLAAQ